MATALEEELNEQGEELGVMGNAVISYPRTVQILAGYEDLQRESLLALVMETGMGDHLMMRQQKQLLENPEGHKVRRFVEGFLAEFVATDAKFSEQLSILKGPVCSGVAVPSMVSTMVRHMKTLALSKLSNSSVPQQQVKAQVGTQHMSTSTPMYVEALRAAAGPGRECDHLSATTATTGNVGRDGDDGQCPTEYGAARVGRWAKSGTGA
jgi:hypothetical protein